MSKKKTVLQVLPRLVTGGVERGTVEIATALVKAGWRAVVASEGGPMAEEIVRAGGVHIELPLASKNPFVMMRNIGRLAALMKRYDVDIIHARSRAPAWSAFYAARRTKRHFVTTFHNAYGADSGLKRFYNSIMARGERVIAISDFVAAYAEDNYRVPRSILRVIPRGVDIERFDPTRVEEGRTEELRHLWQIPASRRVVMLPGRFSSWKGQKIFIDAVGGLARREAIFLLVGGGGESDDLYELRRQIDKKNVEECVRVAADCNDMPAAFRLADFVVSASTRPEGFGRVIVEAQAMGCPVIATAHGGARETVREGETGWLIPANNVKALTAALQKALELAPEIRARMGQRAIEHVRSNFTTARMAASTLAVYEELLRS